ncbi:lipoxygenase homology domain-containing protein 1-like isoform X1 [Octopus sinensis]|uniref:Lipoxygenase homology domain-containing protein 1-like isoform X1 n=1 Tax=Octopus sinensis TaxID=2607531 RepID=A0A7E6F6Q1_9MOLL|nr:lipoxygenase homology domain-containing protein 1-like isoform X1 [Octopus sinensis]XP_036363168.1 lipoxygenase homology domain-containing protein 1-like isoform X1 [Octopus sinensis]
MWLAADERDGLIKEILEEGNTVKKKPENKQRWFLWVSTSESTRARPDSTISVVVYGLKGKSNEILLSNRKIGFKGGQTYKFEIATADIGTLYKIRIWHDNSGTFSGYPLEKVEMENSKTSKRYEFLASCCWSTQDEGKRQIVQELPASGPEIKNPLSVVHYIVVVYTGDVAEAGTDANVFVNIFGKLGDTGQRYLEESRSNQTKFERGQVDEFLIEAVDLKELTKIHIGHDASNPGSGWFLEKVEIRVKNDPSKLYLFHCNSWLALDKDDGTIVKELPRGDSKLLNTTNYEIHVKTGNVRGAGTDANVFLQMFGSKNNTDKIPLVSSENLRNLFERDRIDIFKRELTNIGQIKKIKISHDNSQLSAGWFLDSVFIKVPSEGKHYMFDCFRWLAVDEEDGQTEVVLEPSVLENRDKAEPCEVTLWTGNVPNAGTNANIYIKLYGDKGKSEEYTLNNRSDNFEQGSVDTFKIEIPNIGNLHKILVHCDGKGVFAGWFLHKILIRRHRVDSKWKSGTDNIEPQKTGSKKQPKFVTASDTQHGNSSNVEQHWFIVDQWFDKDANSLTKELVPTDLNGKPLTDYFDEVEYTVKVVTGDVFGAGTDANVFLTIYGDHGDTSERNLSKSQNMNKFERSQEDIFTLNAIDLGKLKKIKIWHDNSGSNAAWFLDYVEVRDNDNQQTFFPCQWWLATNEGDGQIVRELVPVKASLKKKLLKNEPESLKTQLGLEVKALTTTYHVKVHTADRWGAGTDANVYVILYGHLDNSGKILLKSSITNSNKFERNQIDEFIIEVIDTGELQKIKIGHDDTGLGSAWCLDKVIIDCPSLGKTWNFPCGRWLAKGEDDGLLERELYPQPLSSDYIPYIPYEITTYTGDVAQASTDANVYIALYSKDKRTQQKPLCLTKNERKQKFRRNAVDKFILEMENIGDDVEKIRIGHDGSGFGAGWYLAKVEVRKLIYSGKSSKTFVFPCNQWLAEDEDDQLTERLLLVETSIIQESTAETQHRSHKDDSTTDQLLHKLPRSYRKYTHQELLNFQQKCIPIGYDTDHATANHSYQKKQVYRIIITTSDQKDASISDDVWFILEGDKQTTCIIEKIKNSEGKFFQKGKTDGFTFTCPPVGEIKNCYLGAVFHTGMSSSSSSSSSHRSSNANFWLCDQITVIDEVTANISIFQCNNWVKVTEKMSKSDSVRLCLVETMQDKQLTKKKRRGMVTYEIQVYTGDVKHAGTDANVYLNIFGENGETGRQPLKQRFRDLFERNQKDTFFIKCLELGKLRSLFIEHDSSGFGSGWFLDRVEIINKITREKSIFPCKTWLDKKKGTTSIFLQPKVK